MSNTDARVQEFLELVNRYPSPHNGQPMRLKQQDTQSFAVYFCKERGLQSTDISFIFSFVSIGVFMAHMRLCAQALGHGFNAELTLPRVEDLHGEGVVKVATCTVDWNTTTSDEKLRTTLRSRQTSRKKYYADVSAELDGTLVAAAERNNMRLRRMAKPQTHQAVWLNQRAVFDDLFNEPVRRELDHWLRYSQAEKQSKKDGLAYDCMELDGALMKRIIDHPRILRVPVLSWVIKQYYLRTMRDASSVFYMMAPFATEKNAYDVGEVIMHIWRLVAEQGYYLHPFGTIMSNHAAHQDFLKLAGETNESREYNYLVFIFRCGKSAKPAESLRIPYKDHLIME